MTEFEHGIRLALDAIVDQVTKSATSSELPIEIDRASLLEKFGHAIVPQKYLIVSNDPDIAHA